MDEDAAAHHLLNVIEERELNVDLDRVLAAFEDEGTKKELAGWVNEYLHEETLLTKEELQLYETLKKKGLLQQFENEEESARPILDNELISAIESLQSSTAAIAEQCEVLEAQKEALAALKALDKPNLSVEHMRNERRRKENQEKARLDLAVEDVSTTITEQLSDSQRDIDAEKDALKSYVTERLQSDDKILTALPNIVSKLLTELGSSEDQQSIDQWCKAIITFRTAEVKARVDTVYLSSLKDPLPSDLVGTPESELKERKGELQAELETLHSEIASVAEMVVEHELRKPMIERKERKERDRLQSRRAWLKYVLSTLDYMSKRLDAVSTHTQDIDQFRRALVHISNAASQRMPDVETESSSPTRKRATSGPKSAISPVRRLKPSKSLDLPPAIADALRYAGVSFNVDNMETLRETLLNTQLEREKRLEAHYVSSTRSTHDILAERLGCADVDLRAVLDALYLHTPFQQVNLLKPEVRKQLELAEKELANADRNLQHAETNEISLSDANVRAFVDKYGPGKK